MRQRFIVLGLLVVTACLWGATTFMLIVPEQEEKDQIPMCKVSSWGWTDEEAQMVYPYKELTPCTKNRTLLTVVGDMATVSCLPGERASYILSPKHTEDLTISTDRLTAWISYTTSVNISEKSFIYARCNDMQGHESFDVYIQAPASEMDLESQRELLRQVEEHYNGGKPSPPTKVFVVSLDSVGRQSFMRNFKQTHKLLSTEKSGVWTIDFKQLNVAGFQSQENVVPLLTGLNARNLTALRKEDEDWEERSIWQFFKAFGFRAVLGLENHVCDYCEFFGHDIHPSRVFYNFYRLATEAEGFIAYDPIPHCVGGTNSHNHLLKYMLSYASTFHEFPVFQYAHIHPGHEVTQQVARLADKDIKDFIIEIEQRFHDEPYLIVVMADHGHAYHSSIYYANDAKAALEYKIPTLFFRFNDRLQDVLGDAAVRIVQHNAERLISPKDLYATFVHLALANAFPKESPEMLELTEAVIAYNTRNPSIRSLFMHEVPDSRTCADIDTHAIWCGCLTFADTPLQQPVIDYLLEAMNLRLRNTPYCQPLTVHKIQYFKMLLDHNVTHYSIEFLPEADPNVSLYGIVSVSTRPDILNIGEEEVRYRDGLFYLVQIMQRLTSYQGVCFSLIKVEALNVTPDPAFCICADLGSPASLVKYERVLQFRYLITVKLTTPGQNCLEICSIWRGTCFAELFNLFNVCDYLSDRLDDDHLTDKVYPCAFVKNDTAPYVHDQVLYINEDRNFSCTSRTEHAERVCPCIPK